VDGLYLLFVELEPLGITLQPHLAIKSQHDVVNLKRQRRD
jgi:hypothetical protein